MDVLLLYIYLTLSIPFGAVYFYVSESGRRKRFRRAREHGCFQSLECLL